MSYINNKIKAHLKNNKKHYHLGILWTLLLIRWIMMYPHVTSLLGEDIEYWTWELLSWENLTGEYLTWELLSWELLSWELLSWDLLSWELLSWELLSWELLSWELLSWELLSWEISNSWLNETWIILQNINTWEQQLNTWILLQITWLIVNINPIVSWYVWMSGVVEINFTSNKILTWITSSIYWTNHDEIINSWLDYKIKLRLTKYNLQWSQNYNIFYQDLDWNTWNIIWTWNAIFDKIWPEFSSLEFTWNYNQVTIRWNTNEKSIFKIVYWYSWNENIFSWNTINYGTSFSYNLTWLDSWLVYNFNINFTDIVNNISSYSWNFYFDQSGSIKLNYVVDSWYQEITTWTDNIMLLQELKKFNECKDGIKTTEAKANIFDKDYFIQIPNFYSDETKRTIAVLSYDIVTKLKDKNANDDQINEIIKKYNNFLTIIKLVKDDNNVCEQNFSLYYISRFQNSILDILYNN